MNPNGTISEILSHKGSTAWSISPDATVFEAIQMMADKNVGALLVTENDKLVGIISERDYTRKVVIKGKVVQDDGGSGNPFQPRHPREPVPHRGGMHAADDRSSLPAPARAGRRQDRGHRLDWGPGELDYLGPAHSTISQLQTYITGVPG
jgi:hypothetical protein